MKALSVRGPWWWWFFRGEPWRKDVENRGWPAPKELIGRNILIHAARTCTQRDFDEACQFAARAGALMFPQFDTMKRGGIVGMVRLVRCVRLSESPWFVGRFGFVFDKAYPLPFEPCDGQPGFFEPFTFRPHSGGALIARND